MKATYLAPWGPERLPATFLERHCAICRVLELPYDTRPKALQTLLNAAPAKVRQAAEAEALACASRVQAMFSWRPEDADDSRDPFQALLDGKPFDHFAAWGGRGGTKSHRAAEAIVELASNQKERVAGAREYMKRIKESSKELFDEKVKASPWAADWESTEFELRNKKTGSVIIFIGLNGNNAESVGKSLEGVTILWTDEAQLLTQRSIDIILPTIRAAGSRCIWTWNPGEDPSPIDQLFRGGLPPERSVIACRLVEHNPYLYRTRLAAEMRSSFLRDDEDKFRHIWRGGHLERSDATVFTDVHVGYFNFAALPCQGHRVQTFGGMDFGYGGQDPSAAVKVMLILPSALPDFKPDSGMKPVLYISREAVDRAVPNHELWKMPRQAGLREVFCDSAMPLMISAIQASGEVNAYPARKPPGSLLAGIRKMESCTIIIAPDCPTTIEEVKGLRWAKDPRTNKIRKPLVTVGEDHCIAAIRYAISEVELTELQNDGVEYA